MNEFVKIDNHNGLVRDVHSRAILVTDKSAIENYKCKIAKQKSQAEELNSLRNEVAELKNLLNQVLEKIGGN